MADYLQYTDDELLKLIRYSDEGAFTVLMNRYWDKLLAIAVNRLQNLEEAEECIQDVFYNFWRRREKFELQYSITTYLSVAVRYQALDMLQKQYRHNKRSEGIPLPTSEITHPSPEELMLEKELKSRLEATVKQLPEKCRIVFRMSREEGMSHKEIAKDLNISEKTVENHITRALKDIRGNLGSTLPPFVVWICLYAIDHKI